MSFVDSASLFLALAVLAATPSVSVLAVTARAAGLGFRHGAYTALGIVVGDLIFILIAAFGLALLSAAPGAVGWVGYVAGVYLVWLGVHAWRAAPVRGEPAAAAVRSSFMSGLLITLGDQKAILLYLGFLPAFVNLAAMTIGDVLGVMLIAVVAVGGVKLGYAAAAARGGAALDGALGTTIGRVMQRLAALVMLGVGVALLVRTTLVG